MATYTGKSGVLKINDGSALQAVAEIRSFTMDSTMDTIENTSMGAAGNARSYKAGLETATFTAEVLYSAQEKSGQATDIPAFLMGSEAVAFEMYPSGSTQSATPVNTVISGNAIITGYSISSSFDDMVTATISAQVSGALAYGDA